MKCSSTTTTITNANTTNTDTSSSSSTRSSSNSRFYNSATVVPLPRTLAVLIGAGEPLARGFFLGRTRSATTTTAVAGTPPAVAVVAVAVLATLEPLRLTATTLTTVPAAGGRCCRMPTAAVAGISIRVLPSVGRLLGNAAQQSIH